MHHRSPGVLLGTVVGGAIMLVGARIVERFVPRRKEPGETSGWLYLPIIAGLITAIGIAIRVD